MEAPRIYESEYRFCEVLWEHEPINSTELVRLCRDRLGWKKSTTYTVIKRLTQRGVVKSENAVVTSLVSREEVKSQESREFVDKNFGGSLPMFLSAFASKSRLSESEIGELRKLIKDYDEKPEN